MKLCPFMSIAYFLTPDHPLPDSPKCREVDCALWVFRTLENQRVGVCGLVKL